MGAGIELRIILTEAEYNKVLRCTVESGRKLPRNFAHHVLMAECDTLLNVPAKTRRKRVKATAESIDLSHLTSDAAGPVATPSEGS